MNSFKRFQPEVCKYDTRQLYNMHWDDKRVCRSFEYAV